MNPPATPTAIGGQEDILPVEGPVRVLCVEDNDGDYGLLREYLKRAAFPTGIALHRATSMADVREIFSQNGAPPPYDVILLDLSLPDSHGAETYYSLRVLAARTAVAILSGNNDQELALQLVQSGAQDYLPKDTLSSDLLMRCVTYAIKRQQYRLELEDLTERLRRTTEELKSAQRHLIQVEKLESLGRLASSVAHEVKNPLGVVQMGLDFLKVNLAEKDGDVARSIALMQDAVARADTVIHDMLDYSRSEDVSMNACPLNEIVECVERMLRHECNRRGIAFQTELAKPSPVARCDRNGIEQVLINLVSNAIQAMGKGGTVTVRTRRERVTDVARDEGLRQMNVLRVGDEVAVIEVQDQGPGIPNELLDRIFEPFFTTKPTGEGTGLGLPICKRVVDLHRGRLLVANVVAPRGTLASVTLKAEAPAEPHGG